MAVRAIFLAWLRKSFSKRERPTRWDYIIHKIYPKKPLKSHKNPIKYTLKSL
jgi:hypothetical protein